MMLLIPALISVCCLAYVTKRKKVWNCFRRRNKAVYTYRAPLQVSDWPFKIDYKLMIKKRDDIELERAKTRRQSEPSNTKVLPPALYQISDQNEHLLCIPDRRSIEGTKRWLYIFNSIKNISCYVFSHSSDIIANNTKRILTSWKNVRKCTLDHCNTVERSKSNEESLSFEQTVQEQTNLPLTFSAMRWHVLEWGNDSEEWDCGLDKKRFVTL